MRILMTGADGFVGQHLKLVLRDRGHHIIEWCGPAAANCPVNLLNPSEVAQALEPVIPEVIIHLAAQSSVKHSWTHPQSTFAVNVLGTLNLWEAIRGLPIQHFIYISSSEVYGSYGSQPLSEEMPMRPKNPYGISKAAVEQLLTQLQGASGQSPRLTIFRPFNHIGPGQSPAFAIPSFVHQIRNPATKIIRVGDLSVIRDFLDVRDVVSAYSWAIESPTISGVYNLCSGVGRSLQEILHDLVRLSNRRDLVVEQDVQRYRPQEVPVLIGDPRRFERISGWRPRIPWEKTLQDILTSVN
ncbi:NAD-dependent epimerase/dehydratase [Sulfobacillus acidophilus DSM 10332]|uniref:NAD-dependent epimerase/dehydratase n=1 Tax=Sulfobacillus acidophilus (strain ATCC 700253 / DSM 10332 / NAL) TaxID=679936 RepID=G8TT29_SULAD|nr:NAD-dependent epimerase/dehydratase [Sulfobacillus acidophilus DSM 10332]